MGEVWLYRDQRIGRKVAMKVLRPEQAGNPSAQARFLREAQVQGQLEHPSVVPVYDLAEAPGGGLCFTMKSIRGLTLGEIIEGLRIERPSVVGRFNRRRLLTSFATVCQAIDYAHRHGVIHRDLKPSNIMLGDFGEIYVLDWGLARLGDSPPETPPPAEPIAPAGDEPQTVTGLVMGTPGYMAPEQVRGDELRPACDVHALGVILFELLTLERLHRGSVPQIAAATLAGVDARPSARTPSREIAPELDAICVRATAARPEDRYTAAELHAALESYLDGERDTELRRDRAATHAAAAARHAAAAAAGDGSPLESRRQAMQEIAQALAMDPTNVGAIETMIQVLTQPPTHLPPEVDIELDRADRYKQRWVGKMGTIAYSSFFLFIPLILWMGVRDPLPIVIFFGFLAVAAGLSASVAVSRRPSWRMVMLTMVASNIAWGIGSVFVGPLVLMPGAVAINATAFAVFSHRGRRALIGACALGAMLIPLALELTGVVATGYGFQGGAFVVEPRVVELPREATLVFLTATGAVGILTGCFIVGHIRDNLYAAEKRLMLYAWHLREFIPQSARRATDPTVGRTYR
jgi:serine/threonine-protein kinase